MFMKQNTDDADDMDINDDDGETRDKKFLRMMSMYSTWLEW